MADQEEEGQMETTEAVVPVQDDDNKPGKWVAKAYKKSVICGMNYSSFAVSHLLRHWDNDINDCGDVKIIRLMILLMRMVMW